MKLVIVDKIGLCYDDTTIDHQGLGGSESAVILMARALNKIGFDVTVINNCKDSVNSKPGTYNGIRYIDNSDATTHQEQYDIAIISRTVEPFLTDQYKFVTAAKYKILWAHDTFIQGDHLVEDLVLSKKIDYIFTLSDWHTSYLLNCNHGKMRNYEVLKKHVFQTRNGAVCYVPQVDLSKKNPNLFVYNASATKGMVPLVEHIWPRIKEKIPDAILIVIGGYYRFREGAEPDAQETTVSQLAHRADLTQQGIIFTGVIPQHEIAKILSQAWMMLYPGAFPETFGISTLESLLYKTPLVTTRFGALEETAIDQACYHIDYAIEPNSLFPHIDQSLQIEKFLQTFFEAYANPYLHQQKQNYCDVVHDIASWDTVALQWKQFFYKISGNFLPVDQYRQVSRINKKVSRIFGRVNHMPAATEYNSAGNQRRIVIISPFWNAKPYLESHIKSVITQDYNNYLHLLIDDNSTDDSKETVYKYSKLSNNLILKINNENKGAIFNQLSAVEQHVQDDDIVMLLDGDDWLINNNTIFHYYNDLYDQGYEFTYGSMWSVADSIPLVAQEYPLHIRQDKQYRSHQFNWRIPYTHLRTVLGRHIKNLDNSVFKDTNGNWMRSGHDNPLFYELIERVDSNRIYCNREIVCNYNDTNPLNDYKIRSVEQNINANLSYTRVKK
jgi:glycosyltransferase involved in cell wall biosynthesis